MHSNRAYNKVLPYNWEGTCTIGTITRQVSYHSVLHRKFVRNFHLSDPISYQLRELSGFEGSSPFREVGRGLLPTLEILDLQHALVNISKTIFLEKLFLNDIIHILLYMAIHAITD